MSVVRVVMRSQISVACLHSERVLRRRQVSCSEVGALLRLDGAVVVGVLESAPMLQEKGQCTQENGPTVNPREVRQQLLLWFPWSRAQSLAAV